jgi:hypothetical protein
VYQKVTVPEYTKSSTNNFEKVIDPENKKLLLQKVGAQKDGALEL